MKKILLSLLILTSLIPTAVQAQQKFEVGLKVGVNISDFTGPGLDNHEVISRTSYHVGLLGEFSLAPAGTYSLSYCILNKDLDLEIIFKKKCK